MKIMIVEDDPVSLAILKKTISKTSSKVISARNGAEAWETFMAEVPRLVVSDWMLPELSGIDLCRKIRETETGTYTYVIIMTAKDNREDVLAAFAAGADDYIAKPYDIRELQARMNTGRRIIQLEDNHKALQEKLISSRAKVRTVFDALPEEIISVDRDSKLVSANNAAEHIMKNGYSDIIGMACCDLVECSGTDFYKEKIQEMVQNGFATRQPNTILDRYRNADGDEVIKERTCLPVLGENGEVKIVTIVSRDITAAQKSSEEISSLNQKLKKISSELIKKNATLESTLANLERTQAQMVQSEKMASIGQLAAGVAHEINNPTGFVSSNLKSLGDYQDDISRLLSTYQSLKTTLKEAPADSLPEPVTRLVDEVEAIEEDIDIEYIQEDVSELIDDCREGTERIKKIVEDLKHFAHPGEDKKTETDINKGLESTLNVVYNELKYKATVTKEFNELPLVYGFPQQLNQVFMNILVNAAQAIEKSGEIHIRTDQVDGVVEVRISDTGCGISPENLSRIFDPFFTTKDVGKGTGLGMNIAYNIIQKHDGDIRVESTVGKGTTFIIHLPATIEPGGDETESTSGSV
jgi:two-component system, NtrC family, sensor kinase